MGVLAGGANWGSYGPSLVPVLPQAPGVLSTPPQPLLRYGPGQATEKHYAFCCLLLAVEA